MSPTDEQPRTCRGLLGLLAAVQAALGGLAWLLMARPQAGPPLEPLVRSGLVVALLACGVGAGLALRAAARRWRGWLAASRDRPSVHGALVGAPLGLLLGLGLGALGVARHGWFDWPLLPAVPVAMAAGASAGAASGALTGRWLVRPGALAAAIVGQLLAVGWAVLAGVGALDLLDLVAPFAVNGVAIALVAGLCRAAARRADPSGGEPPGGGSALRGALLGGLVGAAGLGLLALVGGAIFAAGGNALRETIAALVVALLVGAGGGAGLGLTAGAVRGALARAPDAAPGARGGARGPGRLDLLVALVHAAGLTAVAGAVYLLLPRQVRLDLFGLLDALPALDHVPVGATVAGTTFAGAFALLSVLAARRPPARRLERWPAIGVAASGFVTGLVGLPILLALWLS